MSADRPNAGHMQSLIQNIMRKFETRAPVTNTSPSTATSAPSAPEPQQPLQPRPVPSRQVLPTPSNYSQASNSVQQVDKPKVAATFLHFYAGSNNKSTSTPTTTSPSDQHRQYTESSYSSEMRHPNDFQYQPSNFYSAPPRSVEESPSTLDQVLVRPTNENRPRNQERVDPPPLDATTRSLLLQFQARPASFKIDSNLFKRPTVQPKPGVPGIDHPSPESTPLVGNEAGVPDVRPAAIEQPSTHSSLETNQRTHPNEPLTSAPISAVEVQHPTSEPLAPSSIALVHLTEAVGSCRPSPLTEYDSCGSSLPIEQQALMPAMPTVASTLSTDEAAVVESVPEASVVTATEANGESQRVLEERKSVPAMNSIHVPTPHPPAVHAEQPPHLLHAPHVMDNLSALSSDASEVTTEQQPEPAPMSVPTEMDRSIAEPEQARLIAPHSVESVEANVNQLAERAPQPQLLALGPVAVPSTTDIAAVTIEPPSNAVVVLTETDVQKLIVENERMIYNAINDRSHDDISSLPTSGPCLSSLPADEVMHYDGPSVCSTDLTEKGQHTDPIESDLSRPTVNVPANEQSPEGFGPCQPTSETPNEVLASVDSTVNEPMMLEVSESVHPAESMKDLQADSNLTTHANTEATWNTTTTILVNYTETSLNTAPTVPVDEISSVPLIVDELPPIVDSLPNNTPTALYVSIASDVNPLPKSDASTEELHGPVPVLAALPEQAVSPSDQQANAAHQSASFVAVLPSQTTTSMVHERVIETKTPNVEASLLIGEAALMPAIERPTAESTQGTESLHTAASDRLEETAVNCKDDTEHVTVIQQPFEHSDAVEDGRTCAESIEMHKELPAQPSEIADTTVPMEQAPLPFELTQRMVEDREEAPLALPVNVDFRLERALPTSEQDVQMSLNETVEREGQLRPIEVSALPSEPSHSISLETLRAPEQTVVESASAELQRIHQSPEGQYFAIPATESAQQYAAEEVNVPQLVVHGESGCDVEPPSDQYVEHNAASDSGVHQNTAVEDALMADTPTEVATQPALPPQPDIEPVNDFVAAKSAQVTRDETVNDSADINTCTNLNFSIDGERFQREQVKALLDDEDHVLPPMKFHSEATSEPHDPVVETRADFPPVFDTDYSAAVEHLLNPDEEFEPVDIFNPDNLTPLEVFIFTLEGVPLRFNKQSTSVSTSTAINAVKSKKRKRTQTLHPNFLKHLV